MKMSEVSFRLLTGKGVDVAKFVQCLLFMEAHGMSSNISIYDNFGALEATITSGNGAIYMATERPNFSYYDDIFGYAILLLPNVSIPEVACSKIVGAGKMANDLIEFGEENAFLKGCGTILSVENDEIALTVKLLPNWIEIG